MTASICLHCPHCNARLKAPAALLGQWRNCPGCTRRFLVHVQPPQDAGPLLVEDMPPTSAPSEPSAA